MILGFIKPSSGRATVGGHDCHKQRNTVHRLLSYVPGDARLERASKAITILKFYSALRPEGNLQRACDLAERLELNVSRRVAFMSTGMRQKLALAICLSMDVPLLILDEPTANLDPTVRHQVLEMVQEAKAQNRCVIFSSHVLSEVEFCCDEVVMLKNGKKELESSVTDLKGGHLISATLPQRASLKTDELTDFFESVKESNGQLHLRTTNLNNNKLRKLSELGLENLRIDAESGLQHAYDRVHHIQSKAVSS